MTMPLAHRAAQQRLPHCSLMALAALLLLLGACTAGPEFTPPPPPPPQAGYGADGAGRAMMGEAGPREWWKSFGSSDLDALVARALASNYSLAASRATLERARERIAAVTGQSLPQVQATARSEYERVNLAAFGFTGSIPGINVSNPQFELFSLGAGVRYDLDLAGGKRRALERTLAEAETQQRETEMAHQVVAGRTVLQVLAIGALNDRISAERALLSEDEHNLALTEARQRGGVGTMVDVLSARGQLANDRAGVPALEQQLAEGRGMLAILLGISPAELGPTAFTLGALKLPEQMPVALPSALVHSRPDSLAAEARLHAAMAAIGVAEARLYPDIAIGASLTQAANDPANLTRNAFRGFDLFAGLTAPIFDGGTLKAEKRGAEAAARAAAATYQQVVLEAFGQVAGLLSALDTDSRSLAIQREAADISERSLYLSRRSFQVGNSGILQVLDASRSNQRAKLTLLEAQARQFLNVARLQAATAGGWTGANIESIAPR